MAEGQMVNQRNARGDNPPIKGGGKRKNRDARKAARKAGADARAAAAAGSEPEVA